MTAAAVWQILVEECGARPGQFDEFAYHWPQCREFRFQGDLGFGGKVYAERPPRPHRVDCYTENYTPERRAAIARANERLADLASGAAS